MSVAKSGVVDGASEDGYGGAEIMAGRVIGRAFVAWIANDVELEAQGIDSVRVQVRCEPLTTSTPTVSPLTDAVIALQIAVGSRPPDLRWGVSGDKRVTSLDALMILQAAAHAIDL